MLVWQKRARIGLVLLAAGVGGAVLFTTRQRTPPPQRAPVERTDPDAAVETTGAEFVVVKGERESFTVRADKQLSYPDGSSRLLGNVKVTSVRQGKTFVAEANEAKIGADRSHVDFMGGVRLSASDGLAVSAAGATYAQNEGLVRAPGPVTFQRDRLNGTGVDFTYNEKQDVMSLSDRTVVTIAADEKGANSAHITSGASQFSRKDRRISFQRAVHVVRPNQTIDAESAVANLTDDEQHLTGLDLQGGSRITTPNPAPGGMAGMAADAINLSYAQASDVIQRAALTGGASVKLAGDKGAAARTLGAGTIDLGLGADGETLVALSARDKVVLSLPGQKGQASKRIQASSLNASGAEGKGLTSAVFSDAVEYRESGGTPPVRRVVTSRTLETTLAGGFGEIRDAHFIGNTRFRDGSTEATAASVRYDIASGRVKIAGNIGNARPHVADEQIAVDAADIDMTLQGPRLRAIGGGEPVRTVLFAAKPGSKDTDRKTPRLMRRDRDVNGWSDSLTYDGTTSSSEFTGGARLTQGDTFIRGNRIDVNGKTGNMSADGSASARFQVTSINLATGEKEASITTGYGETLDYVDGTRTVTFDRTANLKGAHGDLTAAKIVLTLAQNGDDIEQLEAFDSVKLVEPEREFGGEHLLYLAEGEEYRLSGKGKLVRMKRQGCNESTGKAMTFSRRTGKLVIEGSGESRSQTKQIEANCTPPPPRID